MQLQITSNDGVTLNTKNKYCKEDISIELNAKELSIIPSATEQTNEGIFNKVTVAGDENIKPENIKLGVSVFGVLGELAPGIDTSQFRSMASLYSGNTSIEEVVGIDISNAKDLSYMFYGCTNLKKIEFVGICKNTITNFTQTFRECYALEELTLQNINFAKSTRATMTFYSCNKLKKVTFINCDFSNITTFSQFFAYCSSLENIDGEIDLLNSTNVGSIFQNSPNVKEMKLKNLKASLDISNLSKLSYDSLLYLLNNVQTVSNLTLKIGTTNLEKLNATEEGNQAILNATNKGWTVT